MVANTEASGRTIKWRAKANLNGLTVASMKATTSTTRRKVTVHSTGPTEESTMANGKMESSMASANIQPHQARPKKVSGRRESALPGSSELKDTPPLNQ